MEQTRADDGDIAGLLGDDRLTLVGLMIEAQRGLVRSLRNVHESHGLSGSDFDVLLRLARSEGNSLRMADLAAQTVSSNSGLTTMVDRLQASSCVERLPSESDRRSFIVKLTDEGKRVLAADIAALLPVIEEGVIEPLGRDAKRFHALLERVRDALVPEARAGGDGGS